MSNIDMKKPHDRQKPIMLVGLIIAIGGFLLDEVAWLGRFRYLNQ